MDPFTTILRAVIGKKMVEGAKQAYNETRTSVDKFFSDWDASLKEKNAGKVRKESTSPRDIVARAFEANGTINTDPLAGKGSGAAAQSTATAETPASATAETTTATTETPTTTTEEDDTDVVTYTYKPGDTFGQVLLNLGLSDSSRLWGAGGDVEYYTQQLRDQNMLDARGNVKLGIPFKLRRRK